jgi:hypothetical protein
MDVGVHRAWGDRIDPNPMGRHFLAEPYGQGFDASLGSGVMDILGRGAKRRRND